MLKNCFANNPAAPYVTPVVKTWPGEYVNPAAVNAFGRTRPGYTTTYRLDPRDAIVMYGKMPPPGRYMGLQTWEFSQHGRWKARDYLKWARTPNRPVPMQYLFDTIPPNDRKSGRTISLSALGNIVNNVVMRRQSGYSFGKTRYFIITPSVTTDHAVRRVGCGQMAAASPADGARRARSCHPGAGAPLRAADLCETNGEQRSLPGR